MKAPRLIVRAHDPRRMLVRGTVALLIILAAGVTAYLYGHRQGGIDLAEATTTAEAATAEVARLESELRALRARLASAERSGQVDGRAHSELRAVLATQNDEILALREELEFYRGIVSPTDSRRGLRVHDFRVYPMGDGGAYRFRLVLIQAMQHDRQAQGTAQVTVVGTRDGAAVRLALAELGDHPADGIPYDFRYFQEFDGDILLPGDFVPNRVEVDLTSRSARDGSVNQVFDWVEE